MPLHTTAGQDRHTFKGIHRVIRQDLIVRFGGGLCPRKSLWIDRSLSLPAAARAVHSGSGFPHGSHLRQIRLTGSKSAGRLGR
ncbi:hypothetical protein KNE206_76930 [Kitasatospora sp. NE20-6]